MHYRLKCLFSINYKTQKKTGVDLHNSGQTVVSCIKQQKCK